MIEVDAPRPLAGDEVLLEVRAAGVGNWDEFVRTGGWDVLWSLRRMQLIHPVISHAVQTVASGTKSSTFLHYVSWVSLTFVENLCRSQLIPGLDATPAR
jgi:hypothetical protein